jgi:preprotein translocase subunit SecG
LLLVDTALNIVMIIVSVILILVILMQGRGSSFSGGFGSDSSSMHHTRRGIEKTLFQFTIGVGAIFVALAILSSLVL